MKNTKEFDRTLCFSFYRSYLEQGELIREQLGDTECAKYFIALIRYGLFREEPSDIKTNMLMAGLKNTIDAGQEKRRRGFEKENTKMSEKILEYKEQNPNSTQREIADACDCSLGKVNKTLKKSTLLSDNSYTYSNYNNNSNSNLNNNTMNVNTNTFSISEDSEEERELDDLSDEELTELLKKYRGKTPYGELYKKYKLKSNILDKTLPKKIEEILRIRKAEAKKREFADELHISLEDYEFLSDSLSTYDGGAKTYLELISDNTQKTVDINDVILFFKDNPQYTLEACDYCHNYSSVISQAMLDLGYIK